MKIKLLTGRVGTGFSQEPGSVIDVPEAEARQMIAELQAEPVKDRKPQTAQPKGDQ